MSARKIGLLLLLLAAGGAIEAAWSLRGDLVLGPEGCRVIGGRFYGPSWTFEQADERPLAGVSPRLDVKNAFGGVRVSPGAAGVVKVRLRKVVYRPTEEKARAFAERIELRLSADGSSAEVTTNRDVLWRAENVGFETHFEIEVPSATAVTVRNEHGPVQVEGVARAEVSSSHDEVVVQKIAGDVRIESRHGDVKVADVSGALDLGSRHGGVEVRNVKGQGKLDVEHGNLSVRDSGGLEVAQHHGSFEATGVAGALVVRASHAGVKASDVLARAEVETSYAGIRLARVGGSARAKAEHGPVSGEDVSGGMSVEASHAGVELDRVGGPVEVSVDHGGVEAKGMRQGARVRASGGDVQLAGFSGAVEVELDRGSARLVPRAPIAAPVTVTVTHGEAELELTEGSRINLEAESRRGQVHEGSLPPELTVSTAGRDDHRPGQRLTARVGEGGTAVSVRADGDVRLSTGPARAIAEQDIAQPAIATAAEPPARPGAAPAEAPPTTTPREATKER